MHDISMQYKIKDTGTNKWKMIHNTSHVYVNGYLPFNIN